MPVLSVQLPWLIVIAVEGGQAHLSTYPANATKTEIRDILTSLLASLSTETANESLMNDTSVSAESPPETDRNR